MSLLYLVDDGVSWIVVGMIVVLVMMGLIVVVVVVVLVMLIDDSGVFEVLLVWVDMVLGDVDDDVFDCGVNLVMVGDELI